MELVLKLPRLDAEQVLGEPPGTAGVADRLLRLVVAERAYVAVAVVTLGAAGGVRVKMG